MNLSRITGKCVRGAANLPAHRNVYAYDMNDGTYRGFTETNNLGEFEINIASDPDYDKTVFLLNGVGLDGSTDFVDPRGNEIFVGNDTIISSDEDFPNGAVFYPGTTDYLRITETANLVYEDDFTIEFDFKIEATRVNQCLYSSYTSYSTNTAMAIFWNHAGATSSNLISIAINGSFPVLETDAIALGEVAQIQVCREDSTVYLFKNGILQDTYTYSGTVGIFGGYI